MCIETECAAHSFARAWLTVWLCVIIRYDDSSITLPWGHPPLDLEPHPPASFSPAFRAFPKMALAIMGPTSSNKAATFCLHVSISCHKWVVRFPIVRLIPLFVLVASWWSWTASCHVPTQPSKNRHMLWRHSLKTIEEPLKPFSPLLA